MQTSLAQTQPNIFAKNHYQQIVISPLWASLFSPSGSKIKMHLMLPGVTVPLFISEIKDFQSPLDIY